MGAAGSTVDGVMRGTWFGAFVVHFMCISPFIIGAAAPFLVGLKMGPRVNYTTMLLAAVLGLEGNLARKGCWSAIMTLVAYLGPRSPSEPGFWSFIADYCVFAALTGYIVWGWIPPQPRFVEWVWSMQPQRYYTQCELRGELDDIKTEASIFGYHPHGITVTGLSWNMCWSKKFNEIEGAKTIQYCLDKNQRENNPGFKLLSDAHGRIHTLSKQALQMRMADRQNISFVVGGFEDATLMFNGKERTALKKRTGFIKYALQYGPYRLHPVYTFGESDTYRTYTGSLKFRLWLNKFGIPAVIFWGLSWCPILPRPDIKLITVIGKAVELPRITDPQKADVEKWHGVYCDALVALFEQHKIGAGLSKDAKLELW
eukprot:gnl/TRDRNA2_/TRDRNA2_41015_c0_seq1.p1 gnl/TRDRNA2_/TRDRNA2_41015_c0~~gnl/TRDRNA2_/TRDRNA2_41015_c0_seq1.p1  ORF type:complete len:397 (-),score=54.55 gnl/TRDRNA2_/TRDRNA2_41015_c0_seq1:49-1161(-)